MKTKNKQVGKGDSLRPFNYKKYNDNYSEIEWRDGLSCCNCGVFFSRDKMAQHPNSFISYPGGTIECRECNFN